MPATMVQYDLYALTPGAPGVTLLPLPAPVVAGTWNEAGVFLNYPPGAWANLPAVEVSPPATAEPNTELEYAEEAETPPVPAGLPDERSTLLGYAAPASNPAGASTFDPRAALIPLMGTEMPAHTPPGQPFVLTAAPAPIVATEDTSPAPRQYGPGLTVIGNDALRAVMALLENDLDMKGPGSSPVPRRVSPPSDIVGPEDPNSIVYKIDLGSNFQRALRLAYSKGYITLGDLDGRHSAWAPQARRADASPHALSKAIFDAIGSWTKGLTVTSAPTPGTNAIYHNLDGGRGLYGVTSHEPDSRRATLLANPPDDGLQVVRRPRGSNGDPNAAWLDQLPQHLSQPRLFPNNVEAWATLLSSPDPTARFVAREYLSGESTRLVNDFVREVGGPGMVVLEVAGYTVGIVGGVVVVIFGGPVGWTVGGAEVAWSADQLQALLRSEAGQPRIRPGTAQGITYLSRELDPDAPMRTHIRRGDWGNDGVGIVVGAGNATYGVVRLSRGTYRLAPHAGEPNLVRPTAPVVQPSRAYRVQGGIAPKISHERVVALEDGTIRVIPETGKTHQTKLYITFDDPQRSRVYLRDNRPDGQIVSFEVDPAFVREVQAKAKPQKVIRENRGAPEISDPRQTTPEVREALGLAPHESTAYGLPPGWFEKLEKAAVRGSLRIEK